MYPVDEHRRVMHCRKQDRGGDIAVLPILPVRRQKIACDPLTGKSHRQGRIQRSKIAKLTQNLPVIRSRFTKADTGIKDHVFCWNSRRQCRRFHLPQFTNQIADNIGARLGRLVGTLRPGVHEDDRTQGLCGQRQHTRIVPPPRNIIDHRRTGIQRRTGYPRASRIDTDRHGAESIVIKQAPGLLQSVGEPQSLLGRRHRHDSFTMKRCRLGPHINDVRTGLRHLQGCRRDRRRIDTASSEKSAAVAETLWRQIQNPHDERSARLGQSGKNCSFLQRTHDGGRVVQVAPVVSNNECGTIRPADLKYSMASSTDANTRVAVCVTNGLGPLCGFQMT